MSRQILDLLVATTVFLCWLPASALAAKTDVVVLINGNAVTGEVKSLDFGSLSYSTDSMGTVNIDWEDIVTVTSEQSLQIELTDGTRYFGKLYPPDERHHVRIVTASQEIVLESSQVVRMTPIETGEKFIERLDGSFSLGFQTQKASEVTTSNLAADVSYRTLRYLLGVRLNSSVTDQASEPTTARQSLALNYQRIRPNRWFTDWFTTWEKNDAQEVAGRGAAGVAWGRYIIQTNTSEFSLAAGVQGARTNFIGDDETTSEAEGRIEIRYLRRRLTPETSLRFTTTIYPLLEDFSEYRAESDFNLRWEVFEDFFLETGITFSYFASPPADAENSDYTATTSIGYSF